MSKSNQVYDLVIHRLVNAEYKFGERLLVKELGKETGASRQPIMSALNRLSVDGFVRIIPQVGCEVIHPSKDEIADFFLMFQRMEGLLAELAAKRRTPEQIEELKTIQARLLAIEKTDQGGPEYVALNRTFHHTIHLMARSSLLDERQRNNFNMIDFFINHSSGFGAFMADAVADHEHMIDAIERQQSDRARLMAEAHISAIASAAIAGLE